MAKLSLRKFPHSGMKRVWLGSESNYGLVTNLYCKNAFVFVFIFAFLVESLVVWSLLCFSVDLLVFFAWPIVFHHRARTTIPSFETRPLLSDPLTVISHAIAADFTQNLPATCHSFAIDRLAKNRVDLVWEWSLWLGVKVLVVCARRFTFQKVVSLWQERHRVWRPHSQWSRNVLVTGVRNLWARFPAPSENSKTVLTNKSRARKSVAVLEVTSSQTALRYKPASSFTTSVSYWPRVFVASSLFFSTLTATNN